MRLEYKPALVGWQARSACLLITSKSELSWMIANNFTITPAGTDWCAHIKAVASCQARVVIRVSTSNGNLQLGQRQKSVQPSKNNVQPTPCQQRPLKYHLAE